MFKLLFPPPHVRSRAAFTLKGRGEVQHYFYFWQKPDKFLATIDIGKEDRMELASVFSAGCASRWEQGKEGALGHYGSEGWRLLEQEALPQGRGGAWSWSPSVSTGCIALAWSSISPKKVAWSGLGLVFCLSWL